MIEIKYGKRLLIFLWGGGIEKIHSYIMGETSFQIFHFSWKWKRYFYIAYIALQNPRLGNLFNELDKLPTHLLIVVLWSMKE